MCVCGCACVRACVRVCVCVHACGCLVGQNLVWACKAGSILSLVSTKPILFRKSILNNDAVMKLFIYRCMLLGSTLTLSMFKSGR